MLLQMSPDTNELLVMASSGEGILILVEAAIGTDCQVLPSKPGRNATAKRVKKHYLLICLIQQSSMSVSAPLVVHKTRYRTPQRS